VNYRRVAAICGFAAAAVFALTLFSRKEDPSAGHTAIALPGPCEQRTLADGSLAELNRGAQISVRFSAAERRVRLERGEASFTVTKNPNRPFIVEVGAIEVHAVGTAFNVRYDPHAVEVLVTEGKVRVTDRRQKNPGPAAPLANPAANDVPAPGETFLLAGQSAVVGLTPSAAPTHVGDLTPAQMEARLAWKPKLIEFDDAPLSAIVAEFNRRNPVRLVVTDRVVANRRMTASFRSDNLEGFVRLLEANIGVKAQPLSDTEIGLARK
jgi:transmembrane sensor